ncbi:TIGR02206 family membrane protein [Sporolactobacillus sp. THM7-7]|nr:TIGR02206 family membrane protein [Sporolactobacillus sp. THM7-7]
MEKYFEVSANGMAFGRFSMEHILPMSVIGLAAVLLFVFRRTIRESGWKNALRYGLAAALVLSEISLQAWFLYSGIWSLQSSLPLGVSDLATLFAAFMLVFRNRLLFSVLYYAGIGSAVLAILIPDFGGYGFPHFRYIEFFAGNGLLIIACLFMIAIERYRPTFASLWGTFLLIHVYAGLIYPFNQAVGANYLYLMSLPEAATLTNYLGPWPWYILTVEAVALIFFLFLYLPFGIVEKDGWKRKRSIYRNTQPD